MDTLKKPKCLPCIHTFCLECLKTYGKEENPGDDLACPLCRKSFKIPANGFENLPNNFFIEDMLIVNKSKEATPNCEVCNDAASDFCLYCNQYFCKTCTKNHGKITAIAFHKFVSLEEKETSQVLLKARPRLCETHKDKPLELYCYDCKQIICLMCNVLKHKQHNCAHLEEASAKFIEQLNLKSVPLSTCLETNRDEIEQLSFKQIDFLAQIANTESAIIKKYDELKDTIDCQKNQLLQELEEIKKKRLKEMQTRNSDVERQLMIMTSFKQYLEELTDKGSACDIAQNAPDLLSRTNELVMAQDEFNKGRLNSFEVTYTPANTISLGTDDDLRGDTFVAFFI